ncbi:cell surface receptor IPT/TIG domain protein, partial [mine drainage metagenome]
VANTWSPTNCSTQFTYGSPLTSGTPQVAWVSRNTTTAGTPVTVYGFNFQSGDTVYFGSVRAGGSVTSPNTIAVTVPSPSGSPTVNVTVRYSSLTSPTTCADLFHYLGPYLSSISPTSGWLPLTVVLRGTNFTSSSSVYFGPNASASVTHVSSTELKATLPSGLGSVAVTVHQSGYTSNPITFTYTPPTPVVTAIVPGQGPTGSGVTVWGQNLNVSSSVYFGSHVAS